MHNIRPACFPQDTAAVIDIFREYVTSPSADLGFQNYEAEFAALPGAYAAPAGCVLLAMHGDNAHGCAALRPVDRATVEMKRVYVRPVARGTGLGRRLVECLLDEAQRMGYTRIALDVLPEFTHAQQLYHSLGFEPAPAVGFNPVPGTLFLARAL
jgi:GNAT superfamily N-acetyltransferase